MRVGSVSNRSGSSVAAGAQCSRRSRTKAGAANPSLLAFDPTADRSDEVRTLQESRSGGPGQSVVDT